MAAAFYDEVGFDKGPSKRALLLPGETVTVYQDSAGTQSASLEDLFSDELLAVPMANPFTADTLGNITFWADAIWVWVKVGTRDARRVRLSQVGPQGPKGDAGDLDSTSAQTVTGVKDFQEPFRIGRFTMAALVAKVALEGAVARVTDSIRGTWIRNAGWWVHVFGEQINAKEWLKGDGTLEDSAQVELLAIAGAGRTIYWPPGTYLMGLYAHPSSATTYAMMFIRSKTLMKGAGDSTILKLPDSTAKPVGASATNLLRNLSGGDEYIRCEDMLVDGNGGNQSGQTMQHQGVVFTQCKGVSLKRFRVKNLHGLGHAPDAPTTGDVETMAIQFNQSSRCSATDCEVERTAGSMSTGFGANTSTNIAYSNCRAIGMSVSCGFAHNGCRNVVHSNCEAYDNALYGFNSENSEVALYAACIAGGRAANTGGVGSQGYTVDENLGNGYGFRFSGTTGYQLDGCAGRYNVQDGALAQNTSQGTINGGFYSNNGSAGIRGDASSTGLTRIVGSPILGSNTAGDIVGAGTGFPSRDLFGFLKISTSPHIAANSQAFVQVRDDGGTLNPEIRFYRPTGTGLWRCWSVKAVGAGATATLEIYSGDQAAVGSETLTKQFSIDLNGRIKPVGGTDTRVVATASLPAAAAAMDGHMLIEDGGAGNRNLIVYAGGQRFRIDGGAAF